MVRKGHPCPPIQQGARLSDLSHRRSRPLVLVADDDRLVRTVVCDALEAEGYTVLQAVNGEEALSGYERYRPSLLILDVRMPAMDGLTVCEEVRRRHSRSVPRTCLAGGAGRRTDRAGGKR